MHERRTDAGTGFEPERQPSAEGRPENLAGFPCGAVLHVGSLPEADADLTQAAFERFSVRRAEGGILTAPQFTRLLSPNKVLVLDPKARRWTKKQLRPDMYYEAVGGGGEVGAMELPSTVSAYGVGVRLEGLTIEGDGKLRWGATKTRYPREKVEAEWGRVKVQINNDFMAVASDEMNENQLAELLDTYRLPKTTSPGFFILLDSLKAISEGDNRPWAVKLQLASPATVLRNVTDRTGKKTLAEGGEEMCETVGQMVALRNRWMVDEVRKVWRGRIIISVDNPVASNMPAQEIVNDTVVATSLLSGLEGVQTIVHSCGPIGDKKEFWEATKVDGVHLDVFDDWGQIRDNLWFTKWLMEGKERFIALGIVPTHKFADFAAGLLKVLNEQMGVDKSRLQFNELQAAAVVAEHYDAAVTVLEERLGDIVNRLYTFAMGQGYEVTKQRMWAKIAVSSACGLGLRDPVAAEVIACLMRDVAIKVRSKYLGVKTGEVY